MRLLISTFVVFSLIGTAGAQETLPTEPLLTEAALQDGSLTGTVRSSSSEVLPGVTVTITNNATGGTQSHVTGEDGRFRFLGLSPGAYTIQAGLGSATQTVSAEVSAGRSSDVEITLAGPDPVSAPATGTVSGTVSSGDANVPDATLDFSPAGGGDHANTETNSYGRYSRDYLTPGTYNVTCSATGFKSSTKSVTVEKDKTAPLDFSLEKE
jgi:Carboxypeptidase regulatory-like domain